MSVASTATYDLTVDSLIATAMRTAGVLNTNHNPSAADIAQGRIWVFLLLQALQNRGIFLRAKERVSIALVANQAYVDAPSDTLSIEDGAIIRNTDGKTDQPLILYDLGRYQALPDKTVTGTPNFYYPEKLAAAETWRIHLYPVPPDTTWTTLIVPRTRRLRDVEDGSVNIDLAPKWYLAVIKQLGALFARSKGRRDTAQELRLEGREDQIDAEDDETPRGDACFVVGDVFGFGRGY